MRFTAGVMFGLFMASMMPPSTATGLLCPLLVVFLLGAIIQILADAALENTQDKPGPDKPIPRNHTYTPSRN